jgi:hypothetical protein
LLKTVHSVHIILSKTVEQKEKYIQSASNMSKFLEKCLFLHFNGATLPKTVHSVHIILSKTVEQKEKYIQSASNMI